MVVHKGCIEKAKDIQGAVCRMLSFMSPYGTKWLHIC